MSKKKTPKKPRIGSRAEAIAMHEDYKRTTEAAHAKQINEKDATIRNYEKDLKLLKQQAGEAVADCQQAEIEAARFKERAFSREHRIELNIGPLKIEWCGPISQPEIIPTTANGTMITAPAALVSDKRVAELLTSEIKQQLEKLGTVS